MKRLDFITCIQRCEGRPYVWGAKGPDTFDCSGLVTACLYKIGGPDWRMDHNCQKLWEKLPVIKAPKVGDLCLYGKNGHASHVMVWVGDGRVFGATGGDSTTTTPEAAQLRGARVKYRKSVDYRDDLLGYRSLAEWLDKDRKQ